MKNKKLLLTLSAAITASLITGCSSSVSSNTGQDVATNHAKSEEVNISLNTPRFTNVYYTNAPLELVVVDHRTYQTLGTTSTAISEYLTPVYPREKIKDTLEDTLLDALKHQGHDVTLKSSAYSTQEIIANDLCNKEKPKVNNTMIVKINNLYAEGMINSKLTANATIDVNLRYCGEGKIHFQDKEFSTNISYSPRGKILTKGDIKVAIEDVLNKNVSEIVVNKELQKFISTNFETIKHSGL